MIPFSRPNLIVGFGANHRCLVASRRTPILFTKSNNCVIPDGAAIEIPPDTRMVWAEVELAVVIGVRSKHLTPAAAKRHIAGYTIANDVNRLNLYNRSEDLAFGKCCDTFLPLKHQIFDVDPLNLEIKATINGMVVQRCSTRDLLFNAYECVSYASQYMTLAPGDVIITGTCKGAKDHPFQDGDEVVCEIEGMGSLTNHVEWQKDRRTHPASRREPALQRQEPPDFGR